MRIDFLKILLAICICLPGIQKISAQSYSFLNVPVQTRTSALGGYNVSLRNTDPHLFMNNPAMSTDSLGSWASAGYLFYMADVGMASFAYRHDHAKAGAFGISIQHLNLGEIDAYDETGAASGSFKSGETLITLNHSRQSGNFLFGMNTKLALSNIAAYRSSALLFDLGGAFVHPQKDFTAGMVIKHMGFVLTDYTDAGLTSLPWDVQAGLTFKPENMPARFSFTTFNLANINDERLNAPDDEISVFNRALRHATVGMEFFFSNRFTGMIGYNHLRRQQLVLDEIGGGAGFSFGLAGRFRAWDVSVARVGYHVAGGAFQFTLSHNMRDLFNKGSLL